MREPGLTPSGRAMGWVIAGGASSALLFFFSLYMPVVGMLFGVLAPLPLMTVCLRMKWLSGVIAVIFAGLLIGVAIAPIISLYFFVQFGVLALVSVYLMEKRASFGMVMLVSSLAVMSGFLLLIGIQAAFTNQGFFEALRKPLEKNITEMFKTYPGFTGPESQDTVKMFKKMVSWLVVLVPSLIVVGSWAILLMNFYFLDKFHLVSRGSILKYYRLNRWRAPDFLIWLVILPGFAAFLFHGMLRGFSLNILIASLTIYFFQGLCVINFYLDRKNAPPFLKLAIYFILFVIQIVALLVLAMGLLDMWMDFRRLSGKKGANSPGNATPKGKS